MKIREEITVADSINLITEDEIIAVKIAIEMNWDNFYTAQELAAHVEHGFIFGPYGQNQHYAVQWILGLVNEIELEKNPPIVEEVPFEEPMDPIIISE